MKRTFVTGLLTMVLGGCLAGDEPDAPGIENDVAAAEAHNECSGIDIAPDELAAEVVAPDAADGAITVRATNRAAETRPVTVTLHAHLGETAPSVTRGPIELGAGETVEVRFEPGELGIEVDRLRHPVALKAQIDAHGADGAPVERTFARGSIGPEQAAVAEILALAPDALQPADVDDEIAFAGMVAGGSGLDLIPLGDPVAVDGAELSVNIPGERFDAPELDDVTAAGLIVQARWYRFCFRTPVAFDDSGFGEDYGTHPTNPWMSRGTRTVIYSHGVKYFDGFLDGSGCTPSFYSGYTDQFVMFGYTYAKIGNNYIKVYNDDKQMGNMVIWGATPGSTSGTKYFTWPETELSNLLAASAFTLARFNGGLSGETFKVNRDCDPDGNCNRSSYGEIWVTLDDRKFVTAHEMGHRILAFWTGGYNNDCSFDLSQIISNPANCDTSSGHSMWSAEYESCAAMEGWANFVAADVFNNGSDGDNPGAFLRYWNASGGPTIDVDNGPTGGATAYYDNVCNLSTASNLGVELDWMRQWWDYHTNDGPGDAGSAPSHAQMMNEISAALPWNRENTYSKLSQAIEAVSGGAQGDRWTGMASWNGID